MINKYSNIIKNICKAGIKKLCEIYCNYDNFQNTSKRYIPASGKVIGKQELFNMIEASLDMWLTTGRFNDEFEKKLASFLNVNKVLTVNSGSSANLLAIATLTSPKLKEKRLKKGDEVITVAAGFPTTINPIVQNGLIPVFVDIDLKTHNIMVEQIEEAISEKTKAIFVAHTLGNPFDVEEVLNICKKYDLWLIEDNCDALGAKYNGKYTGTTGHIATQSFYPAHHITMGEGGALIINDEKLYDIAISFRDWGRDCWCKPGHDNTCGKRFSYQLGNLPFGYDHKYTYSNLGYNLKITDWQAAIGLAQIDKLPEFIKKRQDNFKLLFNGLKNFEEYFSFSHIKPNAEPSWFGFIITIKENQKFSRLELINYLEKNGVGTRLLFSGNILRQPAFVNDQIPVRIRNSGLLMSDKVEESHYNLLPNTDYSMNNSFWTGLWPGIQETDIEHIIKTISNFINKIV